MKRTDKGFLLKETTLAIHYRFDDSSLGIIHSWYQARNITFNHCAGRSGRHAIELEDL